MRYLVLAKNDNETLTEYLEKYYQLLLSHLQELLQVGFLRAEIQVLLSTWKERENEKREFILYPDNSSLIQFFYKSCVQDAPLNLKNQEKYKKILQKEIQLFNDDTNWEYAMRQWDFIPWTTIRLTDIHSNIYAQVDAHPSHREMWGVQGWWERSEAEWFYVYEKTFSLLKQVDTWFFDEINRMLQKVVPLWTAENAHCSSSYSDCIGHIYMWFTVWTDTPEINNLEAVIHECSHNKLNVIFHFDPLYTNTREENYYSPYRPDARHIHWVFLWIHAFVPVVYILMKAIANWIIEVDSSWKEKLLLYHMKNKVSLNVLQKHGTFTSLWEEVMDEVTQVITLTWAYVKKIGYSSNEIEGCKMRQIDHFRGVNNQYPHLEY